MAKPVLAAVLTAALVLSGCAVFPERADPQAQGRWAVALHGGAGVIERANLSPEQEAAYRASLERALAAAVEVLERGGSAMDAVEASVRLMEDDPLFNAGRGAVFTSAGRNELDAAVMDGATLQAGSVAAVTRTRHPITLARAVMERSPHVMLIGDGADVFAAQQGLEQVENSFFFTERRWTALVRTLTERGDPLPARPAGAPSPSAEVAPAPLDERKFGTVGVVALDRSGNLAAGTSTGGTTAKRWGRVGDAPIIGAGTYASNADGCAVSATGTGEYFIRATVARDVCARVARGEAVARAADAEIGEVGALGGDGGLIALDRRGRVAFSMNTSGMYRASAVEGGPRSVAIFRD